MPTPRPQENPTTFGRAAVSMAEQVLGLASGIVADGEDRTQARDRLVAAIVAERDKIRNGGAAMAAAVAARVGFESNMFVDEVFEDLSGEMSKVVAGDIRAWVERERIVPPFAGKFARVTLAEGEALPNGRRGEPLSGVAMRSEELDASAYAMFVPDADSETYVRAKSGRGSRLVTWEAVVAVSPLSDADADTVRVATDRENRVVRLISMGSGKHVPTVTERQHGVEGRKRLLVEDPATRGRVLLEMLDSATEALRGGDEDTARAAIATLEGGLGALRVLETDKPRVSLTEPSEPSLRR